MITAYVKGIYNAAHLLVVLAPLGELRSNGGLQAGVVGRESEQRDVGDQTKGGIAAVRLLQQPVLQRYNLWPALRNPLKLMEERVPGPTRPPSPAWSCSCTAPQARGRSGCCWG